MKKIQCYDAPKYKSDDYSFIENNIYKIDTGKESLYVTSLTFMQEAEFGEGKNAGEISQYPLEDLLDKFYCHISDFYESKNLPQAQRKGRFIYEETKIFHNSRTCPVAPAPGWLANGLHRNIRER